MRLFFIAPFVSLILTFTAKGQVVEKTEEKAKRKTERRLDQKIDKGIDNSLNAIEGLFSKKKKKEEDNAPAEDKAHENDERTNAMMKMFGSSDVDVKESYSFDHRFIIEVEEFDKKGKSGGAQEMVYLVKEGSPIMGIEMEQDGASTEIIYDLETFEIISLINTDGQKIGTTMSLDKDEINAMIEENTDDGAESATTTPQFRKTGNSKEISGYACDEYEVTQTEDMEGTARYWITEEAEVDWISSMANMSGFNEELPSVYAGTGYPEDGSVIQMIFEDDKGSGTVMTVKEIQKGQNVMISTSGYRFMNIPGGR